VSTEPSGRNQRQLLTAASSGPRGPRARARLADDPFARVFPARVLRVAAGVLGRVAPPVGPVIERHGSANPWPWDRFPEAPGAAPGVSP